MMLGRTRATCAHSEESPLSFAKEMLVAAPVWYPEDGTDLKGDDRKLYALAKEAGQRRPGQQGTGDQERGLPVAVAIPRGHRHRHHPEGGQVIRQLGLGRDYPGGVGDDTAEEEGGRLELGAEHVRISRTATATR